MDFGNSNNYDYALRNLHTHTHKKNETKKHKSLKVFENKSRMGWMPFVIVVVVVMVKWTWSNAFWLFEQQRNFKLFELSNLAYFITFVVLLRLYRLRACCRHREWTKWCFTVQSDLLLFETTYFMTNNSDTIIFLCCLRVLCGQSRHA